MPRLLDRRVLALGVVTALALTGLAVHAAHESRLALWYIVHGLCVTNEETRHDPAPCVAVDLSRGEDQGTIVLKDRVGATQYLLIPTKRVTGIEDPWLRARDAPNYFGAAWTARAYMTRPGEPPLAPDDVGLAVNSRLGRSQDQLHIHVDCLRRDVRDALRQHAGAIGARWAPLTILLAGDRYEAMRIDGDLKADPVKLLAEHVAAGRADAADVMSRETLAAVGTSAAGHKGFVLLAGTDTTAAGHAEALLDHACAVRRPPITP